MCWCAKTSRFAPRLVTATAPEPGERSHGTAGGEDRPHHLFHVKGWAHIEDERGLAGPEIGDGVEAPATHLCAVAGSEHAFVASCSKPNRAGQDFEPLVLTQMNVAGNEALRLETDLRSQRPALAVSRRLEEGQSLAGQRVCDDAALGH